MIRGEGASDIGFLEIYIVEVDLNTGGWLSEFRQGDHVYVETAQESSNILYSLGPSSLFSKKHTVKLFEARLFYQYYNDFVLNI